ncbi:Dynamin central domain [Macleaya cordata]|uniref:Dynamin central domain n=1 Tax=Macleaya cordata TaxID=56857 RepID=A0A200R385_MACCD|nr:Dynamin central domain [Macleaya cordata]
MGRFGIDCSSSEETQQNYAPLISNYNDRIRPLLDAVDKLRHLNVVNEGIQLPTIVNASELNNMPRNLSCIADAMTAFMRVLGSSKESLRKILISGEFNEFPDESKMHCTARLAEMLDSYSAELEMKSPEKSSKDKFLVEEIKVLEETKGIGLPNFLPRAAFLTILQRRVNQVADTPIEFAQNVWNYVEDVFVRVLLMKSESYPQLQSFLRWTAHNLMAKVRNRSIERVTEIVEMEKMSDYSCSPEYMATWSRLMLQQQQFKQVMIDESKQKKLNFEMLGDVEFCHLQDNQVVQQAFDIKMRLMAYWKIVLRRLVDSLALHLLFSVQNLINKEMEVDIVNELMGGPSGGGGIERMLEESPSVATKRDKLNRSIKLLRDSKDVVAKIMDRIAVYGDGED